MVSSLKIKTFRWRSSGVSTRNSSPILSQSSGDFFLNILLLCVRPDWIRRKIQVDLPLQMDSRGGTFGQHCPGQQAGQHLLRQAGSQSLWPWASLDDCRCRWSTTRARPRPSSPSWWTSRIPQSPSAPPCRYLQKSLPKSLVSVKLMIHAMDLVQELKEFCGSFDAGMKGLTLSNSDQVKSKTI